MQTLKTFRLFISSTFSDFQEERKVLQTKVFPAIKDYASKQGYSFQPIDLRWGVSNEAQLDQKTLELCLSEVRACKTHIHPNFLIMLGDRYGWVPLPYAIEQSEYEELLLHVESKEELAKWYSLDTNQLPASYVLKERTGKYEDYDTWTKVEAILRDTLQSAVNDSNLSEEQRRKYFLSATEAEIEEGIVPYIKPTKFQRQILGEEDDSQYIFGLFRDIDTTTQIEDKFITDDYEEAQELKERVKGTILRDNTLEVKTKQVNKDSLDTNYLKEFEERMLEFLKNQIDSQKQEEKAQKKTSLEVELEAQKCFAINKRKSFLGQSQLRDTIQRYINNDDKEPLLIYGESGRGKSAIMSKAIEEANSNLQQRVVYRFISATPNSSSSKEILTSIFEELGIEIRSSDDDESFEKFSKRVENEILNLKQDVVIFLDALDQLQNEDNFLWLPHTLPANVKIVLSALEDKNYKKDTKYFQALKTKTNNLHKIPEFQEGQELLETLLTKEDRTIDDYQMNYFFTQYKKVKTPLYIMIAVQEMKSWKSGDTSQDLEDTQQGIIKEYLSNLSEFYHHDKKFVNKVLGYIYASRDGLSESELLQLISQDAKFIKKMAPETFHKNENKELPLIHWSRLQAELKPFLSTKTLNNEELMYFFHREFEDAVKEQKNQREEHQAVIEATQKLILKNQDKKFNANRWGKLYATLITEYELKYQDNEKQIEFAEFLANTQILQEDWIEKCLVNISNIGLNHFKYNQVFNAIAYQESYLITAKELYRENPERWAESYITALNNLGYLYKAQNRLDEAIELHELSLEISKELYRENPERWAEFYTRTLNNLGYSYNTQNRLDEAIELYELSLEIRKELYRENPERWAEDYTRALNNLANSYFNQNIFDKAGDAYKQSLEIQSELYTENPDKWSDSYVSSLTNVAHFYYNQQLYDKASELYKRIVELTEKFYKDNPEEWRDSYAEALNNLASSYETQNRLDEAIEIEELSLEISKELYRENPARWAESYTRALNNLAYSYYKQKIFDKTEDLYKRTLEIQNVLYTENPDKRADSYILALFNLAHFYYNRELYDKASELYKQIIELTEKFYKENPEEWAESYSEGLNGLAISYHTKRWLDKAAKLHEQSLKIRRVLYAKSPEEWKKRYTNTLKKLITYYKEQNRIDETKMLEEELLKVEKKSDL